MATATPPPFKLETTDPDLDPGNDSKQTLVCQECGTLFEVYPSQGDQQFCSRDCYSASRTDYHTRVCEECDTEFTVPDHRADQRFCSRGCYNQSLIGEQPDMTPKDADQPELTRSQIEVAIENATVGIAEAEAQPLPSGGGKVRMHPASEGVLSGDDILMADVADSKLETVENALSTWREAADLAELTADALEELNRRRSALNDQYGLSLSPIEAPDPDGEASDCHHLPEYQQNGDCIQCDLERHVDEDQSMKRATASDGPAA